MDSAPVKIPKLIMQTWKTDKVPDHWQESVDAIKEHMNEWDYVLMTDDMNREFVKEHFPDFLPYYDAFPYNIQRADAIRACWLYVNGGVYLDLDLVIQKDISDLFLSDVGMFFVASGNVSHTITNSFMASKPGNPFWLEYIEEMKQPPPSWAYGKHFKVMTTTGPLALSRVVKRSSAIFGMLPSKLIMPCSVCNISRCDTSSSYIKPIKGQSWNDWTSHVLNTGMCRWRELTTVLLIILVLVIALIVSYWCPWW